MEEISSQSGVSSPNLKEQITRQVLQYVLYGKNPVQMVNIHETNTESKFGNLTLLETFYLLTYFSLI